MPSANSRTIIICIGNELIADDAVGFEIYNLLANSTERVEYCSVGGIDILPLLHGETDLIVVDAVQFGAPPGTVHVISWDELPTNSMGISAHGIGLRETIEIGKTLYPESMPERITLVGVEGRCFNRTRDYMTDEVARAIDTAVMTIKELLQGDKE